MAKEVNKHKCYVVEHYLGYKEIVFAETAGKAKYIAKDSDQFYDTYNHGGKWTTELRAYRLPAGDSHYRGHLFMDWDNMDDRKLMVKELGFACSDEYDLECDKCDALDICRRKEEWEEMQNET